MSVKGYYSHVILILLDGPFKIINIFFQIPVILAVQEYYQAIEFLFTAIFNVQGTVLKLHVFTICTFSLVILIVFRLKNVHCNPVFVHAYVLISACEAVLSKKLVSLSL
jgi:hypothetical protein